MNSAASMAGTDARAELFRQPAGDRVMLAAVFFLIVILGLFTGGAAIFSAEGMPAGAALLGAVAFVIFLLALLIGIEAAAAFRLQIETSGDCVTVDLPARRGHVPHEAVSRTIPLADIAAVETRAEVFRQIGVAAIQQAYRLILRSGDTIELGADHQFRATVIGDAAHAIAGRIGANIRDRGMVDGAPGFLAVVGTSVPDWSAAPVSEAESTLRRAAAANALKWINLSLLIVLIARLIARR